MARRLRILSGKISLVAESCDKNPKTLEAVWEALPIKTTASVWGEEIYCDVPVRVHEENGQQYMEVGDVAYWPEGPALCVFFGRTPVSDDDRPKAYSNVNLLARVVEGDPRAVKSVAQGDSVAFERV